jgi:AraC-like DNA-binding protein
MPKRPELGISAAIVAPVLRALGELGFSQTPTPPDGAEGVVPGGTADAVLDAAAAQLKDEALGLNIARRMPLGSLGTLDYALVTSATLREGLERTARYYALATQRVTLELEEHDGRATLRFGRKKDVKHSRHWLEFSFGIITERIRQTLARTVAFDEVAFVHAAPKDARAHEAFFGRRVTFSAPCDLFSFDAKLLELPLRTAAASLADVLEAKMRALEPALQHDDAYVDQVRRVVGDLLQRRDPSLGSVLARLNTPRRTLQRELARRGTSHSALLDEARRTRGLELLESGGLTVAEVSEHLGFSEPSSFFRAFRRWTGQSPKALLRAKSRP